MRCGTPELTSGDLSLVKIAKVAFTVELAGGRFGHTKLPKPTDPTGFRTALSVNNCSSAPALVGSLQFVSRAVRRTRGCP